MTPKETARSSRHSQQFHRSSKPGMRELPALPPREWLASEAGGRLDKVDFSGDDLASVRAAGTWFTRCLLVGSDLRQADLARAFFRFCDLSGADLTGADLRGARFRNCELSGATLEHALLGDDVFEHCTGLPGR